MAKISDYLSVSTKEHESLGEIFQLDLKSKGSKSAVSVDEDTTQIRLSKASAKKLANFLLKELSK